MSAGKRTGYASLPLHGGKAPVWLFSRMVLLSREILAHIVQEYRRPGSAAPHVRSVWFQAFGCVLGFDWHSSGVTTTVCGAVKESLREAGPEWGLYAAGGKGAASKKSPAQIAGACERLRRDPGALVYASRTAAKVDNAAVQDGYQLYHFPCPTAKTQGRNASLLEKRFPASRVVAVRHGISVIRCMHRLRFRSASADRSGAALRPSRSPAVCRRRPRRARGPLSPSSQ